ncbi:transmembrane protein 255B isoform X3 [Macaca fascicularis]|uniref:transmembrane protein 255B isoform X3 n=1 Tax=Macaca fascicularis TaxID=9541 RepID=UPI003D159BA8
MQPPVPGPPGLLDAAEGLSRRKKTSLWFVGSLLLVSVLIVTVGLAATTRTENVAVGGYYPGVILGFGSFLGIIGINLVENRRQMLVAAIVFISFGVVAAFCCAIVDGVFAAQHIEPRPLTTGRCQFYSSGVGYLYDVYQTEVSEMQAVMTRGRLPPSPGPSEGTARRRRCLCVSSLPCVDSWLQLNEASHP